MKNGRGVDIHYQLPPKKRVYGAYLCTFENDVEIRSAGFGLLICDEASISLHEMI